MTTAKPISRIERVELREVWPHEAGDFTPWLASNIDALGEALGLELEVQDRFQNAGSIIGHSFSRCSTHYARTTISLGPRARRHRIGTALHRDTAALATELTSLERAMRESSYTSTGSMDSGTGELLKVCTQLERQSSRRSAAGLWIGSPSMADARVGSRPRGREASTMTMKL